MTKDDTDYAPADEIGLSQLADAPEATKPSQSPRQVIQRARDRLMFTAGTCSRQENRVGQYTLIL